MARLNGLRIAPPTTSGSSSTSLLVTTVADLALSVCSAMAEALTSTVCCAGANLQGDVGANTGGRVDDDVGDGGRLEAFLFHADAVVAGREVGHGVGARLVCRGRSRDVCRPVGNVDLGAWNGRAGGVGDSAGDGAALRLREGGADTKQEGQCSRSYSGGSLWIRHGKDSLVVYELVGVYQTVLSHTR